MSDAIQEQVIEGRAPTPEEDDLLDWAAASARDSIARANDGLKHLVTLTTALLGGSAALLNSLKLPWGCLAVGMALLMLSLVAALWGILPREAAVREGWLDDIRRAHARYLWAKLWSMRAAATLLVCGFAVLVGGLLATATH